MEEYTDPRQLLQVLEQSRTGWIAEAAEYEKNPASGMISIKPCIHKAPSQSLYLGPGTRDDLFIATTMAERQLQLLSTNSLGSSLTKFTYKIILPEDSEDGITLSGLDKMLNSIGGGFPGYFQNKLKKSKDDYSSYFSNIKHGK